MVLCVKTEAKEAERVKQLLKRKSVLNEEYAPEKEGALVYFPVTRLVPGLAHEERKLRKSRPRHQRLRDLLAPHLTREELERLTTSFDILGSIAIIEVDEELAPKERLIGEAILKIHKNVKTVLKKLGGHEGVFRLQRYALVAGADTRETIVRENKVRLKINLERTYYSVRSATERKRIASLVKPGERVLVMFSGAAPYPCVLARLTSASEIVGVELNEAAHELGVENLKLNKLANVTLIRGDAREVVPELKGLGLVFDRIIMPLPHTGEDFLDEAFLVARKGAIIHLYDFEKEGAFGLAVEKALAGAARNKVEIRVLGVTPCGQHSPRTFRVCVDFEVERREEGRHEGLRRRVRKG